jgi:uncharacterized protein YkwD
MRKHLTLLMVLIQSLSWSQQIVENTPDLIQQWLDAHNQWRDEVVVPQLKWSPSLSRSAQSWAVGLSDQYGHLVHSKTGNGENIFWTSESEALPIEATDSWGEEKAYYAGQKISGSNYHQFGHYTQMIWRETTEVGCAIVSNGSNGTYVVCQYYPPGNYIGQHPYKK